MHDEYFGRLNDYRRVLIKGQDSGTVKIIRENKPCGEYPLVEGYTTAYSDSWSGNITNMSQELINKMVQQMTAWDIIGNKIVKVVFNDPATIVLWGDGEKTVVKTQNGEPFDKEKGFLMAVAKYLDQGKGSYFNLIKKYCEEDRQNEI